MNAKTHRKNPKRVTETSEKWQSVMSDALPFNLNLNLILNKSDYIPTDVLRMIQ